MGSCCISLQDKLSASSPKYLLKLRLDFPSPVVADYLFCITESLGILVMPWWHKEKRMCISESFIDKFLSKIFR